MKRLIMLWMGGLLGAAACAAELQEVPEEAIAELGCTYGTPQMNGFVFVEGRYLAPPYTVTRKGNGLFINRVQIEQPVAWSALVASADAPRKSIDADGDFEAVAPAAAKPAEPAEPVVVAEPAAPAAVKAVKSIDDLFADDAPPVAAAPAPATAQGEDPAVAAPAPAPAPATQASVQRAPDDVKTQKDDLRASLDNQRKVLEQALVRGDMYFFSQRHSRLNGNYGTARTLMGVLPQALRQAQSPQELMQRLNQGGVYFIDVQVCSALYKNKLTFPLLEERQRKIQESEAVNASRRNQFQSR